eukprot:7607644-Alexandrium_andersonii.AAC.1
MYSWKRSANRSSRISLTAPLTSSRSACDARSMVSPSCGHAGRHRISFCLTVRWLPWRWRGASPTSVR